MCAYLCFVHVQLGSTQGYARIQPRKVVPQLMTLGELQLVYVENSPPTTLFQLDEISQFTQMTGAAL